MSQTRAPPSRSLATCSARERAAVRRLAAARLISLTGSGAAFAALAFIMFQLTGESRWVSWTLLPTFGAQGLFAPLAALGDRFDRRTSPCSPTSRCGRLRGAPSRRRPASSRDGVRHGHARIADLVSAAAVLNLVGLEDLPGQRHVAVGRNIGNLVGPILGGVLVAVFAPDHAGTAADRRVLAVRGQRDPFVVSAWLIGTTPFVLGERGDDDRFGSLRDGVIFLLRDRVLRAITLAWVVLLLGAGFTLVAEVVALADEARCRPRSAWPINAGWGGGAGWAPSGPAVPARAATARASIWGSRWSACLGLIGIAPWLWLAVGLMVGAGTGEARAASPSRASAASHVDHAARPAHPSPRS